MAEVLLTFHCARADADIVGNALHELARGPVHVRDEMVLGRDFDDARAAEQVTGQLRRTALQVVLEDGLIEQAVAAVDTSRRRFPVRWQVVPVLARGRLA